MSSEEEDESLMSVSSSSQPRRRRSRTQLFSAARESSLEPVPMPASMVPSPPTPLASEATKEPTTEIAPIPDPSLITRSRTMQERIEESSRLTHAQMLAVPPADAETVDINPYEVPELPTVTSGSSDESTEEKKSEEKESKEDIGELEKASLESEKARQQMVEVLLNDESFNKDLVVRCQIPRTTRVKEWRVNKMFIASISVLFDEMLYPKDSDAVDRRYAHRGRRHSCELLLGDGRKAAISAVLDSSAVDVMADGGLDGLEAVSSILDSTTPVLNLGIVEPAFVDCLIRHAYFADPNVTIEVAFPLRLMCTDYQITGLQKVCDDLLSASSITPEGVCSLLSQSMKYDLKSLQIDCLNKIENVFKSQQMEVLFNSKSFHQMPVQALVALIKSDYLRVKEENLFGYLLVWAEAQEKRMEERRVAIATRQKDIAEIGIDEDEIPLPEGVSTLPTPTGDSEASKSVSLLKTVDEDCKDESAPAVIEEETAAATSPSTEEVLSDDALLSGLMPNSSHVTALSSLAASAPSEEVLRAEAMEEKKQVDAGDELLIAGSSAQDEGQYPVLGSNGKMLLTARDFMHEIKSYIRFPVMDPVFVATVVARTKLFTTDSEYRIVKAILLKDAHLAKPYSRFRRKAPGDFASSIHFVRGRGNSSWVYNGSKDCLEVTASAECLLVGIGLWLGSAGADAHVVIVNGRNEGSYEPRIVMRAPRQSFAVTARNEEPIPFMFPEPFTMEAGRTYTVELHQNNRNEESSRQTSSGVSTLTREGITLTFGEAADSPNGTDVSSGAFPAFYVCS